MHQFKLFVAPGSCARVPTIALEEIGVPFETQLIRLPLNEQKTPEFLAINPKGKVPTLIVDGEPLTENVAILTWLNRTYPTAELLPKTNTELGAAQQIADLAAISGTIHPLVTRIAMPKKFVSDSGNIGDIRNVAIDAIHPFISMLNTRVSSGSWWYGREWSIVDAYVFWVWWRLMVVDYPGDAFSNLIDHAERIQKRPSVIRAMASEVNYAKQMKADGLFVPHKGI